MIIRPWKDLGKKYMTKFWGHTVNKWCCRNVDTLYLILKDKPKQGEVSILRKIKSKADVTPENPEQDCFSVQKVQRK